MSTVPSPRALYWTAVTAAGAALVLLGAPSWAALTSGLTIALVSGVAPPPAIKALTTRALQLGVIALGAGTNLVVVWQVGSTGVLMTALGLSAALALGLLLGRALRIPGDTPLLIAVGTAICGGSAIAAVTSAIEPADEEVSVSLAVVFVLNAVALVIFPPLGHALGLDPTEFGRWAALGIHDTSSVAGAGLAYGATALAVATTTKLARALWIVPVTLLVAITRRRAVTADGPRGIPRALARLRHVRWPWFILGFPALAAVFTWVPALGPLAPTVVLVGQRTLLLALFLIGLSLSRRALAAVGVRPLVLGVVLWGLVGALALLLVTRG